MLEITLDKGVDLVSVFYKNGKLEYEDENS